MVQEKKLLFAEDAELQDFPIREGLTYREKKEVAFLKAMSRGVMLVTGKAGAGKDLFTVFLAALNKYYFSDITDPSKPRKILLDFLPKRAFGEYTLFDGEVMMREINKMAKASKMEGFANSNDNKESDFLTETTENWALGEGEMLLKGAFLYLSELKRYCYCRNPHNPFNKFIGALCDIHRHLDMLIVGTHIEKDEIDRFTYLAKTTHWAKCYWSFTQDDTTNVDITLGRFYEGTNVWDLRSKVLPYKVNGALPREFLGTNEIYGYNRVYDLYPTKNYTNLKPVVRKEKGNG